MQENSQYYIDDSVGNNDDLNIVNRERIKDYIAFLRMGENRWIGMSIDYDNQSNFIIYDFFDKNKIPADGFIYKVEEGFTPENLKEIFKEHNYCSLNTVLFNLKTKEITFSNATDEEAKQEFIKTALYKKLRSFNRSAHILMSEFKRLKKQASDSELLYSKYCDELHANSSVIQEGDIIVHFNSSLDWRFHTALMTVEKKNTEQEILFDIKMLSLGMIDDYKERSSTDYVNINKTISPTIQNIRDYSFNNEVFGSKLKFFLLKAESIGIKREELSRILKATFLIDIQKSDIEKFNIASNSRIFTRKVFEQFIKNIKKFKKYQENYQGEGDLARFIVENIVHPDLKPLKWFWDYLGLQEPSSEALSTGQAWTSVIQNKSSTGPSQDNL